jgi:hypothetical protein
MTTHELQRFPLWTLKRGANQLHKFVERCQLPGSVVHIRDEFHGDEATGPLNSTPARAAWQKCGEEIGAFCDQLLL